MEITPNIIILMDLNTIEVAFKVTENIGRCDTKYKPVLLINPNLHN